jgi:hypothetical protein
MLPSPFHAAVHARLVEAAKARQTVTTAEIARLADLDPASADDMKILGLVLETIADHELAEGRPLLAVVVEGGASGTSSARFFGHARRRGRQEADDAAFHAEKLARVYDHWAK